MPLGESLRKAVDGPKGARRLVAFVQKGGSGGFEQTARLAILVVLEQHARQFKLTGHEIGLQATKCPIPAFGLTQLAGNTRKRPARIGDKHRVTIFERQIGLEEAPDVWPFLWEQQLLNTQVPDTAG